MHSKLVLFLQVISVLALNIDFASAQTCRVIGAMMTPGTYNVNQQSTDGTGFCIENVVGPISASQFFLIQFSSVNINCANGDRLTVTSADRSSILFNYCSPVANQLSNAALSQSSYVFVSMITKTANYLSYSFGYYLLDNSAPTTATTLATASTFATLSTAATTKSLITTTTQPIIIITTTAAITCGNPFNKPNEVTRIVGGIEAVPNSWPWQAYITDGSFMCGASIIDNNWLVTAAHCLEGVNLRSFRAILGAHNLNKVEQTTITRSIIKAISHESYVGQRTLWNHDIAMLKLQTPITYNANMSPVCLPSQGVNLATLNSNMFVTGWGKISGNGPTSDFLRQATISVQQLSYCGASSDNQICAGKLTSIIADACSGDSGGPSVTKANNVFVLSGIVSWGGADCLGDGVYTKVSNYVNWIQNIMKLN